ncbi:MipA/OmpV family protein [Burkholderia sp. Bp9140]|uniref:MipA/OmpV family protein n=1 Tax=Burkholderia sp. Bp9140 TaxID=2184572 RepID=UPI000F576E07|nr:MipA/OmpV family protein [Burkholderia sp. Bp9140]RQR51299.1 MipA/OmpV family protein [Burkholderia sp. Bp9140]
MKHLQLSAPVAAAVLALTLSPLTARADGTTASLSLLGDSTQWVIGASAMVEPRYAGSNQTHLQFEPVFSVQRGVLFADTMRGAGLQYQTSWGFSISESIYYDWGRVDHNDTWRPGSDRLAGMGDVPGSATLHTLIAQQFSPWFAASIEADSTLKSGVSRNHVRAGGQFTVLTTATDKISANIDTWWGDHGFNQAYFGVTSDQSSRTGFAAFSPGGGLYAYSAGLEWDHTVSRHWSTTLQLVGTRYTDKAHGSPIVTDDVTFNAVAALNYSF